MKTNKQYHYLDYLIAGVYIGVSIVLFLYHEPWFDEAQNWLSVKNRSIIDIYKGVALDGHPMAWLLIIMPLAKLGLPYKSVFVFHHILNFVGVYLFYTKSPFHKITKVLFIFSVYILFDYNVICKNYVLVFLLLTILAIIYPQKRENKLIYLVVLCFLINTHVYSAIIGISIVIADFIQQVCNSKNRIFTTNKIKWFLFYYITILTSIALFIGGFLMDKPLNPFSFMPLIELSFYKRIFFYLILPFTYAIDLKIAYLLLLPICILIILMLVRNSYAFLILVSSTFGISYLYYLGYTHSGVHVGILFLAIFYTIWLSYLKSDQIINSENKIRINQYWFKEKIRSFDTLTYRQVVLIFSIITLPYLNYWAVKKAIRELKLPFSNSQNAAKYLIENGYDNTKYEIVTYPADQTLPILPFLRQIDSFNYYGYRKGNYIEWDEELGQHYYHYVHDMNQYFENIRQISKRDSSSIFILSLARNRPKVIIPEDFEVLAKFEGAVIEGENYAIFKLK